ncbi:MAG TPA: four helix bundle protein [Cyclobacteriaceae bacterium]|nr:four helix bundle protein [Cyclobacteriaceae bacterium]
MRNDRQNLIVSLTYSFSLSLLEYTDLLELNKKFTIARQLVRSGTSIGANVREAQNAESKIDFIHKLKIAAKEADEAAYWLSLCKDVTSLPTPPESLFDQLHAITKILSRIIATSKLRTG